MKTEIKIELKMVGERNDEIKDTPMEERRKVRVKSEKKIKT